MLSSVLKSDRAIEVKINIMRAFGVFEHMFETLVNGFAVCSFKEVIKCPLKAGDGCGSRQEIKNNAFSTGFFVYVDVISNKNFSKKVLPFFLFYSIL